MSANPPTDLIHTSVAARLLPGGQGGKTLHVSTIFRWIQSGRLRAWKVGRRYHVSRAELLALVEPVQPARPQAGAEGIRLTRAEAKRQTDEVLRRHGLV